MQLREEACNPCKIECFLEHRHELGDFSALQSLNLDSFPLAPRDTSCTFLHKLTLPNERIPVEEKLKWKLT